VPGVGSGTSGIPSSEVEQPGSEVILPYGTKPHKGYQPSAVRLRTNHSTQGWALAGANSKGRSSL